MSYPVRIKICGMTRVEDAKAAATFGVDAIGLMFYEASPRYIDITTAKAIVAALPPFITPVGVFANAEVSAVKKVIQALPTISLQFHGQESPDYCEQFNRPYIKVISMRDDIELMSEINRYASAQAILLDTYHPEYLGGSGEVFDWQKIPQDLPKPIILAGGLTPENVAAAVKGAKPYAVDVSSGVEKAKGIKDHQKIKAFIEKARL